MGGEHISSYIGNKHPMSGGSQSLVAHLTMLWGSQACSTWRTTILKSRLTLKQERPSGGFLPAYTADPQGSLCLNWVLAGCPLSFHWGFLEEFTVSSKGLVKVFFAVHCNLFLRTHKGYFSQIREPELVVCLLYNGCVFIFWILKVI